MSERVEQAARWAQFAQLAMTGLLFPLVIWIFTTVQAHDLAIATIQGNRYSVQDARDDFSELKDEVSKVNESLAGLEPPQWLIDRIEAIEHRLSRLEQQ